MQLISKTTNSLGRLTFTLSLLMLVAFNNAASGQTTQPSAPAKRTVGASKQPSARKNSKQPAKKPSKPTQRQIPSLDEMLKIALQHNPDIRAAEAKRQVADAELERTRLEVVKSLSAYRVRWQAQSAKLSAAQQELAQAKKVEGVIPGRMILASEYKVSMLQTRLREIETELPFLLGRAPSSAAKQSVLRTAQTVAVRGKETVFLGGKARALAEQIVKLKLKSYQAGERRSIAEIVLWLRRLVEADLAVAKSPADRIVAVDAHQNRLMQLKKMSEALYRAGQTPQDDVLVVTFHLLQADQLMLRTKSGVSSTN